MDDDDRVMVMRSVYSLKETQQHQLLASSAAAKHIPGSAPKASRRVANDTTVGDTIYNIEEVKW